MSLTAEYVRSILDYEPDTGRLVWTAVRKKVKRGSEAGTSKSHGYRTVGIDGRLYMAHRVGVARTASAINPWTATIRANGKRRSLGMFKTAEEAGAAYQKAREEFHPFRPNQGQA